MSSPAWYRSAPRPWPARLGLAQPLDQALELADQRGEALAQGARERGLRLEERREEREREFGPRPVEGRGGEDEPRGPGGVLGPKVFGDGHTASCALKDGRTRPTQAGSRERIAPAAAAGEGSALARQLATSASTTSPAPASQTSVQKSCPSWLRSGWATSSTSGRGARPCCSPRAMPRPMAVPRHCRMSRMKSKGSA